MYVYFLDFYKYFFAWRVSTIAGKLEVQLIFLEGESMGVLSGLCWVSMGGRRGEISERVIFCQVVWLGCGS